MSDIPLPWLGHYHQLFDSALPTGAYAHSLGLEGLVQLGEIQSMDDLKAFMENEWADSIVHVDLPLFRFAHTVVVNDQFPELKELDDFAHAVLPTLELRRASSQIGRQTARLYTEILSDGSPGKENFERCLQNFTHYSSNVLHGALSACLGVPMVAGLHGFSRQAMVNFIQPAIKLLQSGPTEVQRMIQETSGMLPPLIEQSLQFEIEDVGTMSPRWDIASARHKDAERRLYIS